MDFGTQTFETSLPCARWGNLLSPIYVSVHFCAGITAVPNLEVGAFLWIKKYRSQEIFADLVDCQKEEEVGRRSNQSGTLSGSKRDVSEAVQLWAHQDSLEKIITWRKIKGRRKRGRPRWTHSVKEATAVRLQEPSRTLHNRIFWRLLIHRVAMSQR